MNLWAWIWKGRLCTRCKSERTYIWDPTEKVICETCRVVQSIRLREYMLRTS